jgi:hypothetical protein
LEARKFLWMPTDGAKLLADWLTSPENRQFSRTIVNRVGQPGPRLRGSVDDLRSTNPPSDAPLMDALVDDFVKHGYDIKHLAAVIMNSAAYQRSWRPMRAT